MVIPTDWERTMTSQSNQFKPADIKWSERPARLQHRFLVLRKLGQGTYGKVQLALNKENNQEVAIKTIKKAKIESEEDMLRIRREIYIMTSIRHPHIIHINEVFETRQKIVIVMQYASGGELYDYLGCHQSLPEAEARRLFRQIVSAIYYCHKNKICHRDLKLENILLDEKGNAQIADFGLSNIFDDRRRMNTFCGSPLYASPEIVKGTPYKGPEVDCWSLGVLLYTLIYGTMPFDGRNFKELVSQISEGRFEEPIIRSNASGLIRRLLTPDISKRATIVDVCKDKWVNQGYHESLLIGAEKMASEALLKNLGSAKFLSENNCIKNCGKLSAFQTASDTMKEKERKSFDINTENSKTLNSDPNQMIHKSSLYEQILHYDVSFIINKLLVAVESALKCPQAETNPKCWSRNGENNIATKVDSAYVIPIFEVTSVVPKTVGKRVTSLNHKEMTHYTQNSVLNDFVPQNSGLHLQKNIKSNKLKAIKEMTNPEHLHLQKESLKPSMFQKIIETVQVPEANKTNELEMPQISNRENILSRNPSIKTKRGWENQLLGQKPVFRSKNHTLSLARIFSMKYEKLIRNSFKLPKRKQKPPGKIAIPSTFDPSTAPNEIQVKKEIMLFPTVSVSENKEKIEKKIEKIKKAALNMNLILRSNSQNRLKIQKYLMSQAKKMQDLVCDEQRSAHGSMEQINTFPAAYFSHLNVRMQNKKINFYFGEDASPFAVAKSKSDDQFPYHKADLETFNCFGTTYLDSVGGSDWNSKLIRSASDSGRRVHLKNWAKFEISKEDQKALKMIINGPRVPSKMISFQAFEEVPQKETIDSNDPIPYLKLFGIESDVEQCKESFDYKSKGIKGQTFFVDSPSMRRNYGTCIQRSWSSDFVKNAKISDGNALPTLDPNDSTDYFNLFDKVSDIEKGKEYLLSIKPFNYENNCTQTLPLIRDAIKGNVSSRMQRSLSTHLLESGIWNSKINSENAHSKEITIHKTKTFPLIPDSEKDLKVEKLRGLRRRNTFTYISERDCEGTLLKSIQNIRGKSVDSDLDDYIWVSQSEQKLNFSQTAYSSSPNLCSYIMNKNSIDKNNLSFREQKGDVGLYEDPSSEAKSAFLRRILQGSNLDNSSSRRTNKGKSTSENALLLNGNDDFLNKFQNGGKQQGLLESKINPEESLFLSKFLNDLESREQFANTMDGSQRRHPKSSFTPSKRSKLEKRSKSFLQLLSLKRIQEAEKEIERAERDARMDAEEDSEGSLLEALKTHGYKGVISQRFKESENSSLDSYNSYNSTNLFLRKMFPEFYRFNSTYYDNLPQFSMPTYEIGDCDMFNGYGDSYLTMKPSFQLYPDFRQNSPKQFVYDWLTQNGESSSPFQDSIMEADIHNLKETQNISCSGKENSKTFQDEASSSESFDTSKDPMNGTPEYELNKPRDYGEEYATLPHFTRSERNQLRRTSSTSEDEKESVQDRIWRKSFYSRFNNSALSRKERTAFIDSHFSPESRAVFGKTTNFKVSLGDGTDMKLKQIQSFRTYSSDDSVEIQPSKSKSDVSDEALLKAKVDESEPKH
ncbi:NUAK family SNF1-like kinase 1 [Trichonephila inaurata madagascariensis]|uniref:NUAK family SNF1-like kinase 1 n=1 Tax=Trichonephila inaurata madagascariensis TaxID=2747483 RepID=A0A8X7BZ92_9ARAC|nr:NUAK family SNF1-like kinase 1 [Trichonephila inaurata madagascariensis]